MTKTVITSHIEKADAKLFKAVLFKHEINTSQFLQLVVRRTLATKGRLIEDLVASDAPPPERIGNE